VVRDTILLGSDIAEKRDALKEIFEDGYRIIEAENSEQAISCLEEEWNRVALILLDIEKEGREFKVFMKVLQEKGMLQKLLYWHARMH